MASQLQYVEKVSGVHGYWGKWRRRNFQPEMANPIMANRNDQLIVSHNGHSNSEAEVPLHLLVGSQASLLA